MRRRRRIKKRRRTDPHNLAGVTMFFTDYPDWLLARMHGVRFIVEY